MLYLILACGAVMEHPRPKKLLDQVREAIRVKQLLPHRARANLRAVDLSLHLVSQQTAYSLSMPADAIQLTWYESKTNPNWSSLRNKSETLTREH